MIQVEEECREVAGQGEGVGEQEDEGDAEGEAEGEAERGAGLKEEDQAQPLHVLS